VGIDLRISGQSQAIFLHDQHRSQNLAQPVERGAQVLLTGLAIMIRPEKGQQVIAGKRPGLSRQIIEQGPAFATSDGHRPVVVPYLGRTK
jgi:hypothetical protein